VHVPDGFIDAPTSVATGVVAVTAVAACLRKAREELDERTAPMAGLVAAFVFAAQMLNFPVAAGTSGHLLGGALAAILVGPYTGALCVAVVLLIQAVLFADGGITALGTNITLMALTTAAVGWLGFRVARRVAGWSGRTSRRGGSRRAVVAASFAAALVSVPASALVFVLIYAVGGTAPVPFGALVTAMLSVHVLIGIGEAVITACAVGAVMAVRPDLVYGARDALPALTVRTSPGQS
jgi:cobalt/nickel transport system permease protein